MVVPTVTDNSGNYTVRSESKLAIGVTMVTYVVTDSSGNTAFHSFNVTVEGKLLQIFKNHKKPVCTLSAFWFGM